MDASLIMDQQKQKQTCYGSLHDRLITPLSKNDPWFIAHNLEAEDDSQVQIFNNIQDPLSHYRCRIPELQGKRIRGCFHGWMIISNHPHNVMWSLWNPVASKSIRLPPLIFKDVGYPNDHHIDECCLSSPPNDHNSLLLLTRKGKPNFVFCRLDNCKRKKLKWTEMTYAKQLKNLIREDGLLKFLSCCNGKIYALSNRFLIQVDISVNDKHVVIISLSAIRKFPQGHYELSMFPLLKGTCTELFCIVIGFRKRLALETIKAVYLLKLDMTSMTWQRMKDLEGAIFTVDLEGDYSVLYNPAIASELEGYIHLLGEKGKVIYSYHVKDKTISLSSTPCLLRTSRVSEWAMLECRRLKRDDDDDFGQEEDKNNEITIRSDVRFNNTTSDQSHLLNIPLHILKTILEFCVGVEYLKFRATSKHCHLAAPLRQWGNKTTSTRWHTYSLEAPWLMVFDKYQGIMTFIDPMFGDEYFLKFPRKLNCTFKILHSRDGWLLLLIKQNCKLVFFNPFTNHIIKLPVGPYVGSYCFSAPPTSPDCMIVGFGNKKVTWNVYIYFVARGGPWHVGTLDFGADGPTSFRFPTVYGSHIYALCKNGGSVVFKDLPESYYSWETVVSEAPPTSGTSVEKYFLVKFCDRHVLLVTMSELGRSIEVFISNDREEKWEKIYSLGKYMIYICDTTCMCIEAKTPKMENKIYFQRLHSKNGNIVFYSLETCRYHTFDGENIQENFGDFFGTKHHLPLHAWI